jgi:hypothetical protein
MELCQHRRRQCRPEAARDQPAERRPVERAEREAVQPRLRERPLEPQREPRAPVAPVGAAREKQAHRLVAKATDDEAEDGLRRLVEPLNVVDRDQGRCAAREDPQETVRRNTDGPLERALTRRLRAQQGDVDRTALRRWELCDDLLGHVGEQVAERRKAELRLVFDRPTDEDMTGSPRRRSDPLLPDGRLADPRLALEQHGDGPGGDVVEEIDDPAPLGQTTDDLVWRGCHLQASHDPTRGASLPPTAKRSRAGLRRPSCG